MSPRLTLAQRERRVFAGAVLARGLWFQTSLLSRAEAESRAFHEFGRGDRLFSTTHGLVLWFAAPRRVTTESAPGAALLEVDGILCSAPIDAAKLRRERPSTVLVLHAQGAPHLLTERELTRVELWQLVDLSGFELEKVQSLGEVAIPKPALAALPDPAQILAQELGIDPAKREQQRAIVDAMQEQGARPAAANRLAAALSGFFAKLAAGFARNAASTGDAESSERSDALAPPKPPNRLFSWLGSLFGRLEQRLFLGLFARKHGEYLQKLFEMLERHDDSEALRHAIPLAKDGLPSTERAPLQVPQPRSSLELRLGPNRVRGSLGLGDDLFARLRASYERLFERLKQAGQHDEAAFVLLELLNDVERAVSYLELHQRYELAARLSEARKMEPARTVRLWFLAKQYKRAVALAVRHNCFDDAIARLSKSNHQPEAQQLAMLYADRLANAGNMLTAARVLTPFPDCHALASKWLELLRSAGDLAGVGLELKLSPERFDAVWESVTPLLEAEHAAREQEQLARELLTWAPKAAKPILQTLARRLIAVAARDGSVELKTLVHRLADTVGGPLRADIPEIVSFERRLAREATTRRYDLGQAGTREVFDAVHRERSWLLALGEGGVALSNEVGRVRRHFDVPATSLVLAPQSQHVLALSPRGNVQRVSRIHLGTSRSEPWDDLEFQSHAQSFDGERWLIERNHRAQRRIHSDLIQLDVVGDEPALLEQIPLGPGMLRALTFGEQSGHAVIEHLDGFELIELSLPELRLRRRATLPIANPSAMFFVGAIAVTPKGRVLWIDSWLDQDGDPLGTGNLTCDGVTLRAGPMPTARSVRTHLIANDAHFALAHSLVDEDSQRAELVAGSVSEAKTTLCLELEGMTIQSVRLDGPVLSVGVRAGLALAFDLRTGDEISRVRV